MKKIIALLLIFACLACLAGCGAKEGIPDLRELGGRVTEKGCAGEDFQEALLGQRREDILRVWGEPTGTLCDLWGECWSLGEHTGWQIILFYDDDGLVEDLLVTRT